MIKTLARFDARTGLISALRRFGEKPVPSRGGWLFTLGSASLFLLVLQFLTGAVLATAYAPTPDHARESVYFIQKKLPAGALLRGLHHWGASALVVLVALHLARVYFHGAYKPPRQESWWTGMLLLVFVLAFAFTGYLLPWDQKGYWATVVGVRIASTAPGAGPWVARLLAGGPHVGAATLTRFTAIHVIVLPALAALFVGAHLALLRRHGHAGLPEDASPAEPFFPFQAARDLAACLLVFAVILALVRWFPAPLEPTADPSDTSYVPRPDWYFLSLYQLLHYFKGRAEVIGTIVIPTIVFLFLFGMPWWDRGMERTPARRRLALSAGGALAAAVIALTWIAAAGSRTPGERFDAAEPPPPPSAFVSAALGNYDLAAFPPSVLRGGKLVATKKCLECHWISGDGNDHGIVLRHVASRRDKTWLIAHFKDPQDLVPHSKMPPYDDLPERDLTDMADYLLALP